MQPIRDLHNLGKRPDKSLGQHFLVDQKVVADMIGAAKLEKEDTVVEIGSGLGALSFELAKQVKQVIAIEQDRELADRLRDKRIKNLTVITGDALQIDWTLEINSEYKIVANIPYSMTSPLLRKIFSLDKKPTVAILLIQKEMAQRITALVDSSDRGLLTLITEANASAKIIRRVLPGSFRPSPKVESAIIEITPFSADKMSEVFWPLVEAGFRHKRQILTNALTDTEISKAASQTSLVKLGLNSLVRAQNLGLKDWIRLSQLLKLV